MMGALGSLLMATIHLLPDIPAHCILVDPADSSRLFLATDLGVFVSADGGLTWREESAVLGNSLYGGKAVSAAEAWTVGAILTLPAGGR